MLVVCTVHSWILKIMHKKAIDVKWIIQNIIRVQHVTIVTISAEEGSILSVSCSDVISQTNAFIRSSLKSLCFCRHHSDNGDITSIGKTTLSTWPIVQRLSSYCELYKQIPWPSQQLVEKNHRHEQIYRDIWTATERLCFLLRNQPALNFTLVKLTFYASKK